eukprot:TRINITY_DN12287_c0_g1_i1.p1 TRINITY_DN12287_c0_g1~~TRINITY_DN12287_c0_g1_i1.p1  ORF type:complete len:267 (+),score=44.58 TRINITY_DN12287_c0_g1_i1:57-857(+)
MLSSFPNRICSRQITTRTQARSTPLMVRSQVQSQEVGSKVQQWLASPYDALTFGPRFTLGSLLKLPNTLQGLPQDVDRLVKLLQDDRSVEEKQNIILQELEERVVGNLEKGATIEEDVLNNMKSVLPLEITQQIEEIRGQKPPPSFDQTTSYSTTSTYQQTASLNSQPISSSPASVPPTNKVAEELSYLRLAVGELRSGIQELRDNTEISRDNMLKLKVRESKGTLSRRLQELTPGMREQGKEDQDVSKAIEEAEKLLAEVENMYI